jgi:hypothetical protein
MVSLYNPEEPRRSVDLLTEVVLNSNRIIYCHYFMECGRKASKQIDLDNKTINVCDYHFDEIQSKKK